MVPKICIYPPFYFLFLPNVWLKISREPDNKKILALGAFEFAMRCIYEGLDGGSSKSVVNKILDN